MTGIVRAAVRAAAASVADYVQRALTETPAAAARATFLAVISMFAAIGSLDPSNTTDAKP